MSVVLINDTVKKYLLKQSKDLRKRIREKFEFLETGIWDGRLRVKKIKGVSSKFVFEARLDRGNRILFTLGSRNRPDKKDPPVVFVWGLVAHDDISRRTRSIIPENVPFLNFQNYDEILLDNVDMEELQPLYFTQEDITEKVADESGNQRWYPLDEPEWQRIQLFSRDDFELFLYLTPQQQEILKTPLPVMISGTAGSGKTTLSIYYLLNRNLNRKRKIYITYNQHLKNFAQRLYRGLLNERKWQEEVIRPEFYTFKDLCLEIARENGRAFQKEQEVDFNRFNRLFSVHPQKTRFDPALVWEEIRSIIKGALAQVNVSVLEKAQKEIKSNRVTAGLIKQLQQQFILFSRLSSLQVVEKFTSKYLNITLESFCANIGKHIGDSGDRVVSIIDRTIQTINKHTRDKEGDRRHLSFLEYELLGKKKAPNFKFNRKEIYNIFEWYQDILRRENLWDELDLCRLVTGIFSEKDMERYAYDILICDEIQDFTDMQLDLIFNLVKNPKNIFFAGDTKQTINPSGFRWEEVRRHFFERGLEIPTLKYLSLNFRSSGSIVELANILLEIKEKFVGVKSEEIREEWKYKGRPVVVVTDMSQQDMLDILRTAGAKRTVIVRTTEEKQKLQKFLGTELVFTITEAKGLEFDTVVLWKFCDDQLAKDVWQITLDMSRRNIHEAKIKHEINLLYVGITRSRKDLIVYDGEKPSIIWESEQLRKNVFTTSERSFIDTIWNVLSTREEWLEQGHYFFERGHFKAACECFRNGEDMDLLARASAHYFEKEKKYLEAAQNFEKINEKERAAENYQCAREFKKALVLWKELEMDEKIFPCQVEALKQEEKFAEVGRLYLDRNEYKEAVENYEKSRNYKEIAEIYLRKLNNKREAARYYELARQHDKAAALYSQLKSYQKAAELYFLGKNYEKAERLWRRVKDTKSLLGLYRKTGRSDKLFEIYEQQEDFDKAVKYLKLLPDKSHLEKEAAESFARRKYFQALIRYYALDDQQRTAQCYFKMRNYEAAVKYFKLSGDSYSAGSAYLKLKKYYEAVESFLASKEDEKDDYPQVKKAKQRLHDYHWLCDRGIDFFDEGEYRKALALFPDKGETFIEQGCCHALLGDEAKAHEVWQYCYYLGEYERLAALCMEKDLVDIGGRFFLSFTQKYYHFFDNPFSEDLMHSSVSRLMEEYLIKNNDTGGMHRWAKFIGDSDEECRNWDQVLFFMEKLADYNYLVDYFGKFGWLKRKKNTLKRIKRIFDVEFPSLIQAGKYEALALRYLILGQKAELAKVLPKIKVGKKNYMLIGSTESYQQAVEWCLQNEKPGAAAGILRMHREAVRAGEVLEKMGDFSLAAACYREAGLLERAAPLYEEAKNYEQAGDLYFDIGNFPRALAAYKKITFQHKIKRKIARTHEKLGDFEKALKIWEGLKNTQGIKRCMKSLSLAAQKELDFPPLEDNKKE